MNTRKILLRVTIIAMKHFLLCGVVAGMHIVFIRVTRSEAGLAQMALFVNSVMISLIPIILGFMSRLRLV